MKRILIVEDEPGYQELISMLLCDYDLVIYPSVEEAMPKISSGRFDLIICDINLFGLSGFELFGKLKQDGCQTPFIFCSSQFDPATKQRAHDLGATGFIPKPFNNDAFKSLVGDFLNS